MKKVLEYWNKFWFSRFDPISVSLFRIALGLLITIMFICNFFNWERFYDANGIYSLNDVDLNASRVPREGWWSLFWWTEGKIPINVWWWAGIISSIFFTVGFQTRLSTILLYLIQSAMINRNVSIVNGDDLVFRMLLFYSCFAPLNYKLSIDSFLRNKFFNLKERNNPLIWSIRAMQINVILVYLISLPYKLADDVAWINGNAIYYVVANNTWSRCPIPELFYMFNSGLSKICTYGTILIEGGFPLLVWFKKTRLLAILLISSLHIGIAVTVPNVLFFTLGMVCSFVIFLPEELSYKFINNFNLVLFKKEGVS